MEHIFFKWQKLSIIQCNDLQFADIAFFLNNKKQWFKKSADVGIPETPTPLESANVGNGDTPPPLENADVLNGWSLVRLTWSRESFLDQFGSGLGYKKTKGILYTQVLLSSVHLLALVEFAAEVYGQGYIHFLAVCQCCFLQKLR